MNESETKSEQEPKLDTSDLSNIDESEEEVQYVAHLLDHLDHMTNCFQDQSREQGKINV